MYDWEDTIFGIVFAFLIMALLGLVGLLGVMAVDQVQELRAREEIFACEATNLQSVRQTLSTKVVCRARNLGSDTLNIKAD